jgi:hypothetical protein
MARTSMCVDCNTPIIGERLRCPACHDQISMEIAKAAVPRQGSVGQVLIAWAVFVEIIAIVVCAIMLAFKECV